MRQTLIYLLIYVIILISPLATQATTPNFEIIPRTQVGPIQPHMTLDMINALPQVTSAIPTQLKLPSGATYTGTHVKFANPNNTLFIRWKGKRSKSMSSIIITQADTDWVFPADLKIHDTLHHVTSRNQTAFTLIPIHPNVTLKGKVTSWNQGTIPDGLIGYFERTNTPNVKQINALRKKEISSTSSLLSTITLRLSHIEIIMK